ncbi:MAG: DUF1592 domain-containing protein [Myxococcales bacterium]|nr:DUF1592 domain-containing protein [Myxococcales bacterium]MCB9532787.1 DUF1592 domain-containing protein [Myxococcales bacterium]
MTRGPLARVAWVAATLAFAGCGDEDVDKNAQPDVTADADAGTSDTAVEDGSGSPDAVEDIDASPDAAPAPDPATPIALPDYGFEAPAVPRLTSRQYENAVHDLFGADIVVPVNIEPDPEAGGLLQVGAAAATISPRGVEKYEQAAYQIASQAMTEGRREALVGCTPAGVRDDACAGAFLRPLAARAWRQPVDDAAIATLVEISGHAAEVVGDFYEGLEYGIATVLQSPSFMFRVEVGEPDPSDETQRRYTDWEMASRLSFLFWNTIPDEELARAAEAGELTTDAGLFAQAERLLADDRAREGVLVFFDELYGLHRLRTIVKDPTVFLSASPELGPAARQETLMTLADIIFDRDADFRELLTTRRTFIDRRLAALYNVRAPAPEGFAATELPESANRAGLLGQASILALYAHSTSTSATLRGKFIRTVLLCGVVPPPPSGVDTSIPEPSGTAVTLRQRVAEHLENESCANCHALMDPLGLALENYDGLGAWRTLDNGAPVDPSGSFDGEVFSTAEEFVDLISSDPRVTDCVVERLVRYGNSAVETWEQSSALEPLKQAFEAGHFSFKHLLLYFVMSPSFRYTGDPA